MAGSQHCLQGTGLSDGGPRFPLISGPAASQFSSTAPVASRPRWWRLRLVGLAGVDMDDLSADVHPELHAHRLLVVGVFGWLAEVCWRDEFRSL